MLNREKRIMISVYMGLFFVLISICLYGFTVGGEPFSFKYISYCTVSAFLMTSLAFFFIYGKEGLRLFFKKIFSLIVLSVAVIQLIGYQPLNAFTSGDVGVEYEVKITEGLEYRQDNVYFVDKEGVTRCINTTFDISYIIIDENELIPRTGGRMIVREKIGGFNRKYFEIVKVTYEPEIKPFF